MRAQEHPIPVGGFVARLPFPQGSVSACAHISVAVTSVILRNPDTALIAPLVVDQSALRRATERALRYYERMLGQRRLDCPDDHSTYFSPGNTIYEYKKNLLAANKRPWFRDRHHSGYVSRRAIDDDDSMHQQLVARRIDEALVVLTEYTGHGNDDLALQAAVTCVVGDDEDDAATADAKLDSAMRVVRDTLQAGRSTREALQAAAADADRTRHRGDVYPRLVDELAAAHRRATVEHKPQGLILTCSSYTRSVILRDDGQWVYDSHGLSYSALYYFPTMNALASYLLRLCGVTDDAAVAENLAQMNDPSLRVPDCRYNAAEPVDTEFEIVVIEKCDDEGTDGDMNL